MSVHILLILFDGGVSNVLAGGIWAAGRADCEGREAALRSWGLSMKSHNAVVQRTTRGLCSL